MGALDLKKEIDFNNYDWPEVTVAVCVLNGEKTIRQCLDSLVELDYPKEKLHLLIVDNGSTDGTLEIVNQFPVRTVFETTRGRGYARNRAWQSCRTRYIAFTDADCTVSTDWLKTVMPVFEETNVGVAGSDIVTPGTGHLARFFELRRIVSNKEFSGDYKFSPPFLATANAVFCLDAIRIVDGFRVDFPVAEDADICWRISQKSFFIRYVPGGIVYHHHRTTVYGLFRQALDYGGGGVHAALEHYPAIKYWIWWGLYYRLFISLLEFLISPFYRDSFERVLPGLDLLRYTGLALGRISAAWEFKRWIM
ncbi:glycosyltransferase [bacterium]|nr:glycosyltransferase [bacterium]